MPVCISFSVRLSTTGTGFRADAGGGSSSGVHPQIQHFVQAAGSPQRGHAMAEESVRDFAGVFVEAREHVLGLVAEGDLATIHDFDSRVRRER